MNKNAIGLHKFSRIFFGGMMQGLPHAPCRLQRGKEKCNEISASLPPHAPCRLQRFINSTDEIEVHLCLHTLRADCNGKEYRKPASHNLCLHTLRADCNLLTEYNTVTGLLCLHTLRADCNDSLDAAENGGDFASTRSVQIATAPGLLYLILMYSLPPHAPCRLQLIVLRFFIRVGIFASTRSVQIATFSNHQSTL